MSAPIVRPARPVRPQTVLEVLSTAWVTPHIIRVVAGGPGFAAFETNAFTDKYAKIVFAKAELGLVPPFDLQLLRETLPAEDVPVTRTYTIRDVDPVARTVAVDFVVHGDEGIAGPWAARAVAGDHLVLAGLGGAYSPNPAADWHLLVGDESALPAIASALEHLAAADPSAVGFALLEAGSRADVVEVVAPVGIEVRWVLRDTGVPADAGAAADRDGTLAGGVASPLAAAAASIEWKAGRVHVFAHGERGEMKALRTLFTDRGVPREDLSLSGYWALGRTEDRFQAEKREPVGVV